MLLIWLSTCLTRTYSHLHSNPAATAALFLHLRVLSFPIAFMKF